MEYCISADPTVRKQLELEGCRLIREDEDIHGVKLWVFSCPDHFSCYRLDESVRASCLFTNRITENFK